MLLSSQEREGKNVGQIQRQIARESYQNHLCQLWYQRKAGPKFPVGRASPLLLYVPFKYTQASFPTVQSIPPVLLAHLRCPVWASSWLIQLL